MFVVDTNILIYAVNRQSPFHSNCLSALERWRGGTDPWHLTWGNCYEFLRAVTHPRGLMSPLTAEQAWQFLAALIASPRLSFLVPSDRHATVLSELLSEMPQLSGNIMHDVTTVALMREHGIPTIYTHDVGFHRFAGIEVIDPAV